MVLLGVHVSVAGGLINGPINGGALECEAIQIFSKNQRQWYAKPMPDSEAESFKVGMQEHNISKMLIHDSYLINLASPKPEMLEKSRRAFCDELVRAEALATDGLVFHPGAHQDTGEQTGIETIAASLDHCVEQVGGTIPILLETTAGMGTSVGYRFEHLADIIAATAPTTRKRLGICYDTCHTFAAGYPIATEQEYEATMGQFDDTIGLDLLKAFHLNDSKKPFESRRDRHDGIGLGLMGEEPFRHIVTDKRFEQVPAVLEVPGGDEAYARDLKLLREMR